MKKQKNAIWQIKTKRGGGLVKAAESCKELLRPAPLDLTLFNRF